MRKTFFALAAALILFATFSCNKDKDSNNSAAIVGKWTLQSSTIYEYQNGSTTASDSIVYSPSDDGISTVTYNSDKTYVDVSDGETTNGTYTYDASSKKLSQTQAGTPVSITFDVIQLTSNTLQVHYEYTATVDGTTYKDVADATYKK